MWGSYKVFHKYKLFFESDEYTFTPSSKSLVKLLKRKDANEELISSFSESSI